MFSIFPYLLSLENLSPLLLRLTLGIVFAYWAYLLFKKNGFAKNPAPTVLEGVIALLLILGFWTQIAALVACVVLGIRIYSKIKQKSFLTDGVNYYFILFIISLSLLITGPGFLAIDLPL